MRAAFRRDASEASLQDNGRRAAAFSRPLRRNLGATDPRLAASSDGTVLGIAAAKGTRANCNRSENARVRLHAAVQRYLRFPTERGRDGRFRMKPPQRTLDACLRLNRVHFCSRPVPQRRHGCAAAQRVAVPWACRLSSVLMHQHQLVAVGEALAKQRALVSMIFWPSEMRRRPSSPHMLSHSFSHSWYADIGRAPSAHWSAAAAA